MGPLSGHVPRRRRPDRGWVWRARGMPLLRHPGEPGAAPGGSRRWQRLVRYRRIPGCLAGGASGRVHRPAIDAQPRNAVNRPIQCPACPAVRVRYSGVLSNGGDSDLPGRAIRVALRGLQQAAFGDGTPRAAQVGLQGVPEQALSTPWRRCPAEKEPLPDATATHRSGAGEPGRHRLRPGTALLSLPPPPACGRAGLVHCRQVSIRRPASSSRSGPALERLAACGPSCPWRKPGSPKPP